MGRVKVGVKTKELIDKTDKPQECQEVKKTQEETLQEKPKRKTSFIRSFVKNFDILMCLFRKFVPEFIIMALLSLFGLWGFGYIMNGLYGMAFQLDSSLAAVGAISSAGVLSLIRYLTDSKLNSVLGSAPTKALTDKLNKYIAGKDHFIDENKNGIDDRKECNEFPGKKDMNYKDGE